MKNKYPVDTSNWEAGLRLINDTDDTREGSGGRAGV